MLPSEEEVRAVSSRVELADFIEKLWMEVSGEPDGVENLTTDRYLEALAAWVRDSNHDEAYWPLTREPPRWSDVAAMLRAALVYE